LADLRLVLSVHKDLAILKQLGYLLLVVTNQPDVATGKTRRATVEEMHSYLQTQLPLDGVYSCYHQDNDLCECRKPKPGMLLQGAADHDVDLESSFMIGDRWRDIDAGAAAGCRTLLIDYGYSERSSSVEPWARVSSLSEATSRIAACHA